MSAFMIVLMVIAMLITLGVLFAGLFSMARGGEFNKKYGNKLMRYRILAQGAALLLFAIAMLSAGK
ncbi:twin transmembrane helix small protein [Aquibaculum arenosum]|uniref:Twin transmembrane helix small protein n=1 Tax=Aquibaculum arenosum TaxID=3032591 RepID=A0ABT5YKH1_9PROT|nr:twin transmembrane helix small protein [Fodinicurvata sp. CAU 1616]MDF2095445.1 twin transmembrane helix small protein [Fodinicurvata sp. CAU 1616]